MTNDHERSRLDGIIDAVVHDMMQTDPRGDLAGRVRRAVEEPVRRAWFLGAPALAAASFAVVVLVAAAMMLVRQQDAPGIPSIDVASGMPADVGWPAQGPQAAVIPTPAPGPSRSPRPAAPAATASSESIFGPRRGVVGAASVRPASVWLQLTLAETAAGAEPRRQAVTIVLPGDPSGAPGRALTAGDGGFRAAVSHEIVSGALQLTVEMSAPLRRQFTATIRPGERTRIFEDVDASGQRTVIDAVARFLKADVQR